jgi:hypothetical protein
MLSKVAVRDYHPIFRKEAVLLSSAILKSPDALDKHFERASASTAMSMLYDYPTLEDEHDKTVTEVHAFLDRMSAASAPGAHLVELFPWMIYIPERHALISSIVCLITYRNGPLGLQSGNVKEWNISSNIRRCLMAF